MAVELSQIIPKNEYWKFYYLPKEDNKMNPSLHASLFYPSPLLAHGTQSWALCSFYGILS